MKGIEIRINNKLRKLLVVKANHAANFGLQWCITTLPSDYIFATGMKITPRTKNPVVWQTDKLAPGDEITIRLLGTSKPSRSRKRKSTRPTTASTLPVPRSGSPSG